MKHSLIALLFVAVIGVSFAADARAPRPIPQPAPIDLCSPIWLPLGLCPR